MKREFLVAVEEFCARQSIEPEFINSLEQTGLITLVTIEETGYINSSQIRQLEAFIRLYYELDINLEGIETVTHLLEKIKSLQEEILYLKNRLRLFE